MNISLYLASPRTECIVQIRSPSNFSRILSCQKVSFYFLFLWPFYKWIRTINLFWLCMHITCKLGFLLSEKQFTGLLSLSTKTNFPKNPRRSRITCNSLYWLILDKLSIMMPESLKIVFNLTIIWFFKALGHHDLKHNCDSIKVIPLDNIKWACQNN